MKKRRYTAEFKKEAAKMIIIDGTPVKEISQQLGVPEGVLYSWKQKHLAELEENAPEGPQWGRSVILIISSKTLLKPLSKRLTALVDYDSQTPHKTTSDGELMGCVNR